jgi:hypothetical protein
LPGVSAAVGYNIGVSLIAELNTPIGSPRNAHTARFRQVDAR